MSADILKFPVMPERREGGCAESVLLSAMKMKFQEIVVVGTTEDGDVVTVHNVEDYRELLSEALE